MTIMLAGGSDEQTTTLHIRIFPNQDVRTVPGLLDIVSLENDGPNEVTSATVQNDVVLYKADKNNQYALVQKNK